MRQVGSATSQFQKSDEDMQGWYKSYYETINKFYDQRPDLICPNPDELIDILDDLEKQIEKVLTKRKNWMEFQVHAVNGWEQQVSPEHLYEQPLLQLDWPGSME